MKYSDSSLLKFEKFIYNRECLKSSFDKTFENMIHISEKMKKLEQELAQTNLNTDIEDKLNKSDEGLELDKKFFLDFSLAKKRINSKDQPL